MKLYCLLLFFFHILVKLTRVNLESKIYGASELSTTWLDFFREINFTKISRKFHENIFEGCQKFSRPTNTTSTRTRSLYFCSIWLKALFTLQNLEMDRIYKSSLIYSSRRDFRETDNNFFFRETDNYFQFLKFKNIICKDGFFS